MTGDLSFVNLIQASICATSILGALLLWRKEALKGVALLMVLIALAAWINILEESGLTRDIYLVSPIFIMVFGPAFYLSAKHLIAGAIAKHEYVHLLPIIPVLLFTSHTDLVIALGTIWRVVYAIFTAKLLLQYKRKLDQQRSDSDEFSLNWLVWIITLTTAFNLIDLIRLNIQTLIPHDINVLGQGVNNGIWLIASMAIIYKLLEFNELPKQQPQHTEQPNNNEESDYKSIFQALDALILEHQWYLRPRLTLAEVTNLTGIQSRDISRAINLVGKKSFNEYINQYRVEHVCNMLSQTPSVTLIDVANDAGFSSKASFNKVFKQLRGVTPSEYKSQLARPVS